MELCSRARCCTEALRRWAIGLGDYFAIYERPEPIGPWPAGKPKYFRWFHKKEVIHPSLLASRGESLWGWLCQRLVSRARLWVLVLGWLLRGVVGALEGFAQRHGSDSPQFVPKVHTRNGTIGTRCYRNHASPDFCNACSCGKQWD